jgi:hypothetical protein
MKQGSKIRNTLLLFGLFLFLVGTGSIPNPAMAQTGLVAYYPFNGNANDESGNGNNGTVLGGATLTTDRFGNPNSAYHFDGVSGIIEVPDAPILNVQNSITLAAWVYPEVNSGVALPIVVKYRSRTGEDAYLLYAWTSGAPTGPRFRVDVAPYGGANGDIVSPYLLPTNTWSFAVGTYDSSTGNVNLYVDGVLVASGPTFGLPGPINVSSRPLCIGGVLEGVTGTDIFYAFKGKIDDVRVYNRALTSGEISQLYNNEYGLIDRTKWADLEFIRRAENGALHSAVRTYESALNNMLLLKDPSGVNSIEAKVTLNAINTTNLYAGARIGGFFFSDDTGDYFAQIEIEQPASSYLRAYYFYERCTSRDLQCTTFDDHYIAIIGLPNIGESHTLGITYDGVKSFTFKFDTTSVTIPTNANVPYLGLPSVKWKGIGTRVFGPSGPGVSGYVDANFENVLLNGNPTAISISDPLNPFNGMIDDNTWSGTTLEFVREKVSHGVYGMALRSYDSFANNSLNFVNGQNVKEAQADLTVEQFINSPNTPPLSYAAIPLAALFGSFYNDGTSGSGAIGDIRALVGIRHNGTQPAGYYAILRCTQPDCNIYTATNKEYDFLYFYEDPKSIGPDLVGKPHRVSIRWDDASNKFTFGFDGRLTVPNITLPTNRGLPKVDQKGPFTRVRRNDIGNPSEGYVSAQFANMATVVDTDGDGVPDSQDNCPTVYNPPVASWVDILGNFHNDNSQPDFDLDGVGDACDLCPKVANDGGPCPSSVGGGTAYPTGSLMTVTVTYNGPPTYLVPPDCNNVVFNSDKQIPQNCRRIPPYVLTVLEDTNTPGYGSPGGDWIAAKAGDSWTIVCNLLEIFDAAALKAAVNVQIAPTYTFFETDRGLDPAGNCTQGGPGDICVDTTKLNKYNLFQGTIPAQPVPVATADLKPPISVPIDIKPGSPLPKTINLGSQGNIPVAILSTADFNAWEVNPYTVKMGGASVRVVGKKSTLQEEISDVNGDGRLDMIVHFDTQALGLASDAVQVCLTGLTTGGIPFMGCNRVRIVP